MNKGYLSKKSWHTGSLRHIEKVWKAEQRATEEGKRIAELRKELEEERELQQLRSMHQQSTGLSRYESHFLYRRVHMSMKRLAMEDGRFSPFLTFNTFNFTERSD